MADLVTDSLFDSFDHGLVTDAEGRNIPPADTAVVGTDMEPGRKPIDGLPEDDTSSGPLIETLVECDREYEQLLRSPLKRRGKDYEQTIEDGVPEELADEVTRNIRAGRILRKREGAQERDTWMKQGEWYDGLPNAHGAARYIVARTFLNRSPYFPEDKPLDAHVTKLQRYARTWRAFRGAKNAEDAPPRLLRDLLSLPPDRRAFYLSEWKNWHRKQIYQRIDAERASLRAASQAQRAAARAAEQAAIQTPVEVPSTHEPAADPSPNPTAPPSPPTFVAVTVPVAWAEILPALIAGAADQGISPSEALCRIFLTQPTPAAEDPSSAAEIASPSCAPEHVDNEIETSRQTQDHGAGFGLHLSAHMNELREGASSASLQDARDWLHTAGERAGYPSIAWETPDGGAEGWAPGEIAWHNLMARADEAEIRCAERALREWLERLGEMAA